MAVLRWNRPSAWIVVWAGVVLGTFVVRGDLRIGGAPRASGASSNSLSPVAVVAPKAAPRAATLRPVACRVLDTLGQPVMAAEARSGDVVVRGDGDGAFALPLAPGEVRDVLVSAPGRTPAWLRVAEGSPDAHVVQLEPRAPWDTEEPPAAPSAPPQRRGEGVLRDAQGQPLAHAFVAVAGTPLWARTDAFGRFAVPLPAGDVTLIASADGGDADPGACAVASLSAVASGAGRTPVDDLHAVAANVVRGVLRTAGGSPAQGALVAVEASGVRRVVAAGAGGAFRVGGLPAGPCRIAPLPWRGAVAPAQTIELAGRGVDLDVAFVAVEPARVRVVDEAGAPVPGAYVAATVEGLRRGVVRADGEGYAAVPWQADARFDVRLGAGLAPLPVRRFEPEPAQLVVGMP